MHCWDAFLTRTFSSATALRCIADAFLTRTFSSATVLRCIDYLSCCSELWCRSFQLLRLSGRACPLVSASRRIPPQCGCLDSRSMKVNIRATKQALIHRAQFEPINLEGAARSRQPVNAPGGAYRIGYLTLHIIQNSNSEAYRAPSQAPPPVCMISLVSYSAL